MSMPINQARMRRSFKGMSNIYPNQELFDAAFNWYQECLSSDPPISVTTDYILAHFLELDPTLENCTLKDLREKVYRFMNRFNLSL